VAHYSVIDRSFVEEQRRTAVSRRADVIVAGGGPAGLTAAIAAARAGADVILVEQSSFLGGVATGAMMAALVGSHWAAGIGLELIDAMAGRGGAPKWDGTPGRTATTPFDPEVFKDAALEMAQQAGVRLCFYTYACAPIVIDGAVKGLLTEGKSGREAMLADVVVDCTGDADLAAQAGAPVTKGRESDHKMRPFALLFRLGGLDVERIQQYVQENPSELQPQYRTGTKLSVGDEHVISRISGFYNLVEEAKRRGELSSECHYFRLENLWVERGTAICNTTRIYNVDGTNPDDLTQGELEGRRQIGNLVKFARRSIPGCENAFVIDTAPRMGVRETRRIIGRYVLTDEDAYGDAQFPDAIMRIESNLVQRPVPKELDVHMPEPIEGSPQDLLERDPDRVPRERHSYDIPYRCLLPQGVDGLLVAGRTISVSHRIDGTTRNMLVCMRVGQAAGAGAALASQKGLSPADVDSGSLQDVLRQQKAWPEKGRR